MSDKLGLELGLLLPEVPDERDAAVGRFAERHHAKATVGADSN